MDMKRLFITGASGGLGCELVRGFPGSHLVATDVAEADVTNWPQLWRAVETARPNVIVHAAAHTDVEGAEDDPDGCFRVNVGGTLNVIRAARRCGAKLAYISSTGIYGSHQLRPYREDDRLEPPTVHHRSKWEAENLVRTHCPDSLVLRAGWLFGGPAEAPKNFVFKRFLEASGSARIASDPYQRGNPTWTRDLVAQLRLLVDEDVVGTFNCVARGAVTRLEYVAEIVRAFGLPTLVAPAEQPFPRRAPVSANESARNYYLGLMELDVMPEFSESLRAYVEELKVALRGRGDH